MAPDWLAAARRLDCRTVHPGWTKLTRAQVLEAKGAGEIPLDVCLHHHEKMNGSGYPHRLKAGQISLYARMGAVCDVYDAITSNRPYKAGWDPAESVLNMVTETAKQWIGLFDGRVPPRLVNPEAWPRYSDRFAEHLGFRPDPLPGV